MEEKLRTLKDIEMGEEGGGYDGFVFGGDLKKEAIKWVKDKRKQITQIKEQLDKARNNEKQREKIHFPHINDNTFLTEEELLFIKTESHKNNSYRYTRINLEIDRDIIFGQILAYEHFFNITEEDLK